MAISSPTPSRQIISGTVWIFLAEALLLPTGILTAAFLTRQLGPAGYGLLTIAATLVAWVEWSITSVFTRTTIKFVSETEDWRPVGATVLQLHLAVGVVAMLLIGILAAPIATWLEEPRIANYLRLFALDVPLFCLGYAHRSILVGVGQFTSRALATACRWISRLILILLLVGLGLSVSGAILGNIGASIAELVICRFYIRPSLIARSTFPMRRLLSYAIPLFFFALTMRLFEKVDLFALKALGGTTAQVGFYGAAQNLALIPGIFSLSFTPLLLSTLTRILFQGDRELAKEIARHSMRAVLILLPIAGITAGAAREIVALIFGAAFSPAAPLLALLIFGAVALAMISVTTAILTAVGKPNWTFLLTGPLLPLAIAGHWLLIPKIGAIGAATVTTLFAGLGALITVASVYRLWRVLPPAKTLGRSVLVAGVVYALAVSWHAPGLLVLLKLCVLFLLIPLLLLVLGECSSTEIATIRSFVLPLAKLRFSQRD